MTERRCPKSVVHNLQHRRSSLAACQELLCCTYFAYNLHWIL